MATYYVRKSGSDSNNGTSPATAWLTIGKALGAAGIASGDTVYIGAGVYRETVTIAMTSATGTTSVIGDVDGSKTGDAGIVRWTAWTTDDKTTPASAILLQFAGRDFLSFQNILFYGSSAGSAMISSTTTGAATNITFTKCVIIATGSASNLVSIGTTGAPAGTALHWLFDSCQFLGFSGGVATLLVTYASGVSADWDLDIILRQCVFLNGSSGGTIAITKSGANTFLAGGILVQNCTNISGGSFFKVNTAASTSIPCKIYNCEIILVTSSAAIVAANSGEIVEDYNQIAAQTARTNVTAGTNSVTSYAPLLNFGHAQLWGFNPRPVFSPMVDSPQLGFGTDGSVSLTTDMLGRDRPSGPGVTWANTSKAVGCLEYHDFQTKESSIVVVGDSWKLTGPGDCDIKVPLDTTATVLAIQGRYEK